MLLPYIAGQPVMFPGPGPDGQMLAMLLVPFVSAITFPKVTGVLRKVAAPSLKKIGSSFR